MPNEPESLPAGLDRLDAKRLAALAGLPPALAAQVARVVVESELPHDRRQEVFDELVAHFLDGLAAGRTPDELAGIGLYGTVSYSVAQRSREVGIRLSLGAGRGAVVGLLLWGGLRVVLLGGAAGLGLALVLGRLLQGLLFGVQAFDPITFAAVPFFLIAVAILAAYVPARRAGRVDPAAALKAE